MSSNIVKYKDDIYWKIQSCIFTINLAHNVTDKIPIKKIKNIISRNTLLKKINSTPIYLTTENDGLVIAVREQGKTRIILEKNKGLSHLSHNIGEISVPVLNGITEMNIASCDENLLYYINEYCYFVPFLNSTTLNKIGPIITEHI